MPSQLSPLIEKTQRKTSIASDLDLREYKESSPILGRKNRSASKLIKRALPNSEFFMKLFLRFEDNYWFLIKIVSQLFKDPGIDCLLSSIYSDMNSFYNFYKHYHFGLGK